MRIEMVAFEGLHHLDADLGEASSPPFLLASLLRADLHFNASAPGTAFLRDLMGC